MNILVLIIMFLISVIVLDWITIFKIDQNRFMYFSIDSFSNFLSTMSSIKEKIISGDIKDEETDIIVHDETGEEKVILTIHK